MASGFWWSWDPNTAQVKYWNFWWNAPGGQYYYDVDIYDYDWFGGSYYLDWHQSVVDYYDYDWAGGGWSLDWYIHEYYYADYDWGGLDWYYGWQYVWGWAGFDDYYVVYWDYGGGYNSYWFWA